MRAVAIEKMALAVPSMRPSQMRDVNGKFQADQGVDQGVIKSLPCGAPAGRTPAYC